MGKVFSLGLGVEMVYIIFVYIDWERIWLFGDVIFKGGWET